MKFKSYIYQSIQEILNYFDLKLEKVSEGIGIESCFTGLKKRGFIPNLIFDIGASNGKWTQKVLSIYPNCKYYLIEPLIENKQELENLAKRHNISFDLISVGSKDGEIEIFLRDDIDCSSIVEKKGHPRSVKMYKLDTLIDIKNFKIPELVKIDVQGYELEILKGATKILGKSEFVLLEQQFFRFSPEMKLLHEAISFMSEHGYRPYEIVDYMRRPFDGAMGQCDILYANKNSKYLLSNKWF